MREPKASKLVVMPQVTPEYVRQHLEWCFGEGNPVRTAIYRIEHEWEPLKPMKKTLQEWPPWDEVRAQHDSVGRILFFLLLEEEVSWREPKNSLPHDRTIIRHQVPRKRPTCKFLKQGGVIHRSIHRFIHRWGGRWAWVFAKRPAAEPVAEALSRSTQRLSLTLAKHPWNVVAEAQRRGAQISTGRSPCATHSCLRSRWSSIESRRRSRSGRRGCLLWQGTIKTNLPSILMTI